MRKDPAEVLEELRGTGTTCDCGRPLIPALDEFGKVIGVSHSPEDDDWHIEYFSGIRIARVRRES